MSFIKPGKASFIYGGQFGSEGKGLAAAWVAANNEIDVAVTNASANAGHTTVLEDGTRIVAQHLPTSGLLSDGTIIYLSAGAIINPSILMNEIETHGITRDKLIIHPRAAVITTNDIAWEELLTNGSTAKGVGRALARKVLRTPDSVLASDHPDLRKWTRILDINTCLKLGHKVLVEVPQGFSLSLNHGLSYPYCTSRDCTIMQAMSDAGIHPHFLGPVMGVFRTFPIRVGGTSGPWYIDQKEITWKDVGTEPEITTVTKRVRRVATWSNFQFIESLRMNRPEYIFMTHLDYLSKDKQNALWVDCHDNWVSVINGVEDPVMLGSTGPKVSDVKEWEYQK